MARAGHRSRSLGAHRHRAFDFEHRQLIVGTGDHSPPTSRRGTARSGTVAKPTPDELVGNGRSDTRISGRDEERIRTLRRERQDLAAGAPHVSWFARVGMPIVVGLEAGMAGMAIGGRPVPGDGKGMQAMFNGLAGMLVGTPIGMFAGYELGTTLFHGPHMTELPADTVAKVATIDAELDGLLGPA